MSEADIQRAILDYLDRCGRGFWWRMNTGAFRVENPRGRDRFIQFGVPGQADITGVFDGLRVELEVKTKTGKQNENQKRFEKIIKANGGRYYVVRSVEEVREILRGLEEERGYERLTSSG